MVGLIAKGPVIARGESSVGKTKQILRGLAVRETDGVDGGEQAKGGRCRRTASEREVSTKTSEFRIK